MHSLGASDSKSFEFLLVPLSQCKGTNFKAIFVLFFLRIGYLPFFSSTVSCPILPIAIGVAVGLQLLQNTVNFFLYHFDCASVTENVHNIFVLVLRMISF